MTVPRRPVWLQTLVLALALPGSAFAEASCAVDRLDLRWDGGRESFAIEVADDSAERAQGLMFVEAMPLSQGMLFVYDEPHRLCFWMRNTLLPLTIAFIADDGRIVNTADMKPLDESSHCASEPVRFALEMNQGWFSKRGLKPGTRLRGAPFKG